MYANILNLYRIGNTNNEVHIFLKPHCLQPILNPLHQQISTVLTTNKELEFQFCIGSDEVN